MNGRVSTPHIPQITFEVLNIHDIKPYHRSEKSDICFCDVLAPVERAWRGGEVGFYSV